MFIRVLIGLSVSSFLEFSEAVKTVLHFRYREFVMGYKFIFFFRGCEVSRRLTIEVCSIFFFFFFFFNFFRYEIIVPFIVLRVIICCKSIHSSAFRSLSTVKPLSSPSLGSCRLCKLSRYSLFINPLNTELNSICQ